MRILVLGGGGQVARAVAASVPASHAVVVKTRQELNIADEAAVMAALDSSGAEWIVNGAAYTAVDLAEKELEQSRLVNDTAVGVLARSQPNAPAAGCCICRRISCSMGRRTERICPWTPLIR